MTKTKGLLFTAGIVLATAFTISCGTMGDGGGNEPTPSSDSSGGTVVFCKQSSGDCSQISLSTCMELVTAGIAQIVSSCDAPPPPSSSSQPPSSSSTGRLSCGNQTYNPTAQFCASGGVYELCGGMEYNPSTQFCQTNSVRKGWRNIDGEAWWETPSSDPWMVHNDEVGSVTLNSSGGVKFSAVSGSSEGYFLQLSQDGHNLRSGDCYYIELWGSTSSGTRTIQLGFQEIGGSYTGYYAEDFTCSSSITGCMDADGISLILGKYAYISGTNSNARFYINAGYNSANVLTITDLVIRKHTSNVTEYYCESLNY